MSGVKIKKNLKSIIKNVIPALLLSILTGLFTAVFVIFYLFCAKYVILASNISYSFVKEHLYLIPAILGLFLLIAMVLSRIYAKHKNIRGGNISTSFAALRGVVKFSWIKNLFGVFAISLIMFFIGLPFCAEGPTVLMGTAIGHGIINIFARKQKQWDRFIMTGGASAGFAVATGAPLSGMIFVLEEAHKKISPMLILTSFISVLVACITSRFLSPLVGLSYSLFEIESVYILGLNDLWVPIVLGVIFGVFAVGFLKLYKIINKFSKHTLKKVPLVFKIFTVFTITLGFGLWSLDFLYSGHSLIENLFAGEALIYMLVIILLFRAINMLFANSTGLTGGLFVPIITLGALFSAIIAQIMIKYCGVSSDLYLIIIILGVIACIASIMRMPITAVVLSIEIFACQSNILSVILVTVISFAIVYVFNLKSINEKAIESRILEMHGDNKPTAIDTSVVVQKGAFVIGKQIRDVFWPNTLFVCSVIHDSKKVENIDEYGEGEIREGDVLNIRYSSYNELSVKEEMKYLVGTSEF